MNENGGKVSNGKKVEKRFQSKFTIKSVKKELW